MFSRGLSYRENRGTFGRGRAHRAENAAFRVFLLGIVQVAVDPRLLRRLFLPLRAPPCNAVGLIRRSVSRRVERCPSRSPSS